MLINYSPKVKLYGTMKALKTLSNVRIKNVSGRKKKRNVLNMIGSKIIISFSFLLYH